VIPRLRRSQAPRASDAALLADVAAGSPEALGELYSRYARDVWRVVRRSPVDGADVEDIVHATFLGLPRIAPSYDGRSSCRSWLCGIGVHLAMRHRRGVRRLRSALEAFAHTVVGRASSDPERRASGNEALAAAHRTLARLSEQKRAVFVLVEIDGLSAEQVSRALEVPVATVRTRLFHARRALRTALQEGGDAMVRRSPAR
jgi:RNA polymerase sigma-70 factor (ECF subfamily)